MRTGGQIEGDIRMNGHVKEQTSFARVSGYVEQNDVHSPQTTVCEALEFSAQLRFAQGVPADTIQAFVDEVMGLVELTVLQNVLVSGLLHVCSLLLCICLSSPGRNRLACMAHEPVIFELNFSGNSCFQGSS